MKFSIYLFFSLIAVLSGFYLISSSEFQISNFNQVFAQSEENNKNFVNTIITHSSKTANEKIKNNDGETQNFDNAIQSQSSDTSTTIGNKEKIFSLRLATNESPKIHPAIVHILKNANPQALAKTFGASVENDKISVYVHLSDKKSKTFH